MKAISRRRLIEDRDTILELTAKIQELQNEVNCMNDSRDLKDAESVRSGLSHVPSQQTFFPPFQNRGGMLSRSLGMPSRNDRPPSVWDTHGISGNVFADPPASSSAPYPQVINPYNSNMSEHTSRHVISESQTPNTAFTTPATFACWKIRFKTEVCICSQFPTEAMLWIKEVEMVESVDDLKSSCCFWGIQTPDFEVLDAKIASALNRIIHYARFKKKVSLEEMKDRSLTWSTSTSGLLVPMILSKTMPTYLLSVYEMMIFRNSIQSGTEFYCLWRKSHLMTSWKDCTN